MKEIIIHTEFIKLEQLLKLANVVSSGGEAKGVILGGQVLVNGEKELRRGRKVRSGDTVTFGPHQFAVQWQEP